MEEDYRDTMAKEDRLTELENELSVSESPSVTGYGAKPLEVIGGMAIILNQRYGECKDCKWHPYVCQHCEVDQLEDQRIEKEMAP